MRSANVLMVTDERDEISVQDKCVCKGWNLIWKKVRYDQITESVEKIRQDVSQHAIDMCMLSRNDQVGSRPLIGLIPHTLGVGYSTFSGIDDAVCKEQSAACLSDFLSGHEGLTIDGAAVAPPEPSSGGRGTFSIIFDTEQLACARYGLPRILPLLAKYNVPATFYLTNVINKVYPEIVPTLVRANHEVGIHGRWHESLIDLGPGELNDAVGSAIEDLGVNVRAANLMGRMNQGTVDTLAKLGIKSVVYDSINRYRFVHYPTLSTMSYQLESEHGSVTAFPVSVETYGYSWFSIKNMIDSAYRESTHSNRHLVILCHPFRDGNLRNIAVTERMLAYLVNTMKLTPVRMSDYSGPTGPKLDYDSVLAGVDGQRRAFGYPKHSEDFVGMVPEGITRVRRTLARDRSIN